MLRTVRTAVTTVVTTVVTAVVTGSALLLPAAPPAAAGDVHPQQDNIVRASVLLHDERTGLLATLGLDGAGRTSVGVRAFDRATGFPKADLVMRSVGGDDGFRPQDVLLSDVVAPGRLLVLGDTGEVRVVGLEVGEDSVVEGDVERLTFTGGVFVGGRLAEVVDPRACCACASCGTPAPLLVANDLDAGTVHLARTAQGPDGVVVNHEEQIRHPGGVNITDIEAVERDGAVHLLTVAGGAVHDHELVVDRAGDVHPQQVAVWSDPLRDRDTDAPPLLDLGVPRLGTARAITDDTSGAVPAANGTANLLRYELPATTDGPLTLRGVDPVDAPLRQVVVGSLTMLAGDGSGVTYDRRWTPQEGVLRTLWTIAGGSAQLTPGRVRQDGSGRTVTLRVEVADRGAEAVDPSTLRLAVAGRTLVPRTDPPPVLVLADGDRNPELELAVSRAELLGAVAGERGEVPVRVTWTDRSGRSGAAAAVVRLH